MYFMTGIPKDAGNIASYPYTNWKGEVPMDFFVLTLLAHKAYTNFECHDFLLSCRSFLIVLTRLLFKYFANPLP